VEGEAGRQPLESAHPDVGLGIDATEDRVRPSDDSRKDRPAVLARGRRAAGTGDDAAQREDVRPRVDDEATHLLGRHVADRPEHGPGVGRASERGRHRVRGRALAASLLLPRQPEVQDLQATVLGHEQVLGLEVAVEDTLLVRRGQAARRLRADTAGPERGGRRLAAPARAGDRRRPGDPRRIRFGILLLPRGRRRQRLERWFEAGVRRLHCLSWEPETGLRWAELLAKLRATGRAMPVKDSLVAATALTHASKRRAAPQRAARSRTVRAGWLASRRGRMSRPPFASRSFSARPRSARLFGCRAVATRSVAGSRGVTAAG
jgi:hypothetical protein